MKTLEQLLAHLTDLEAENAALKAQIAQHGPGPTGGVSAADVTALTAERDTLKAENLTLQQEVATLKQAQGNFDLRLAEELCKLGIRKTGIPTNHRAADDEGTALTKKASVRIRNHMPASA